MIAWVFFLKHWRSFVVGGGIAAVIIAAALGYGSWRLRGAKIERLTLELGTTEIALRTSEASRAADRIACAEIAQALTVQQTATARWIAENKRQREEYDRAIDEAYRSNRLIRDRIAAQSADTIEAVRRAEGCENKVTALARAIIGETR